MRIVDPMVRVWMSGQDTFLGHEKFLCDDAASVLQRLEAGELKHDDFETIFTVSKMAYNMVAPEKVYYVMWADGQVVRHTDEKRVPPNAPHIMVTHYNDTMVYAIRGTASTMEMRVDIAVNGFLRRMLHRGTMGGTVDVSQYNGAKFHRGILSFASAAYELISKDLKNSTELINKVHVYGHSLGAACAVIVAHLLRANLQYKELYDGEAAALLNSMDNGIAQRVGVDTIGDQEFDGVVTGRVEDDSKLLENVQQFMEHKDDVYREDDVDSDERDESDVSEDYDEYYSPEGNAGPLPPIEETSTTFPSAMVGMPFQDVVQVFAGVFACPSYCTKITELSIAGENMTDDFRVVNYMNYGDGVINNDLARSTGYQYPAAYPEKLRKSSDVHTHGVTIWGELDPDDKWKALKKLNFRRGIFQHSNIAVGGRLFYTDPEVFENNAGILRKLVNEVGMPQR